MALQHLPLTCLDLGQLVLGDPGGTHHLVVDHADAAFTDGSHARFRLEGHAEFAHQADVQRCAEGAGDLCGDRDPSAGQPQHHYVGTLEVLQQGRQPPAGVPTIHEVHDPASLPRRSTAGDGEQRDVRRTSILTPVGNGCAPLRGAHPFWSWVRTVPSRVRMLYRFLASRSHRCP